MGRTGRRRALEEEGGQQEASTAPGRAVVRRAITRALWLQGIRGRLRDGQWVTPRSTEVVELFPGHIEGFAVRSAAGIHRDGWSKAAMVAGGRCVREIHRTSSRRVWADGAIAGRSASRPSHQSTFSEERLE